MPASRSPLLERAGREGTPVIDGNRVTFVWQGKTPAQLMGDFNMWGGDANNPTGASLELESAGPGLWTRTLDLPHGAYVEYCFLRSGKRSNDPLNHNLTPNGKGGTNNFFYMPGASPTPYLERKAGAPPGRVTHHILEAPSLVIGGHRPVHLYAPPVEGPVPLVVVLDGQDYLRRALLPTLLDNLIADNKIRPVAAAMIESSHLANPSARMVEYACSEMTLGAVTLPLLDLAREHLALLDLTTHPGAYAICGASIGGLMSIYAALRAPEVFGGAISQAGAFELFGRRTVVFDLAIVAPSRPRGLWLDVGGMDWLLEPNRLLRTHLTALGYNVGYREYYAYHNYPAWRNSLPDALMWLFPPRSGGEGEVRVTPTPV